MLLDVRHPFDGFEAALRARAAQLSPENGRRHAYNGVSIYHIDIQAEKSRHGRCRSNRLRILPTVSSPSHNHRIKSTLSEHYTALRRIRTTNPQVSANLSDPRALRVRVLEHGLELLHFKGSSCAFGQYEFEAQLQVSYCKPNSALLCMQG